MPNVPSAEQFIEYFTDGSVESIDRESNSKDQSQKLKYDTPTKIMNKTAILSGHQ